MRTLSAVVFVVLLAPLAGGLPGSVDGADACGAAGGAAVCSTVMTIGADATLSYTQETLGCEGNGCTYRPTARLTLETDAPGKWILRGKTWATHYPSNSYLSGSAKELECTLVGGPGASCADLRVSRDVVGDPFNSAKWHGTWELYLVDALGDEHLQAAWSGTGWLAQYCNCRA